MRKHARSWLIKAALGGIIIVFVFWYGWSGPPAENEYIVAEVNGTAVPYDYFRTLYDSQVEQIRLRFGGSMPPGLTERMDLKKSVVNKLVSQLLLNQEAQKLGLFVTDEDLVRDIRTDPLFQRNGRFDEYVYQTYLQKIRLSPSVYERLRREEMLQEQLARLLVDGVKTDPDELKRLWHFQNDKLILSLALVVPDPDSVPKEVDQKELETYFGRNKERYAIPPSVDLEYVAFSWRDVTEDVSVTDAEIADYYRINRKEFTKPEKVRARIILVRTETDEDEDVSKEKRKRIEELRARIEGGESFEAVAKEESEDPVTGPKGGDVGYIERGSLNRKLERIAFDLEPGEVSAPVRTDQGFYLIKVEDKKPEETLTLEQARERVTKALIERKARRKVADLADEFYEQVYRSEDLNGPAEQFDLEVKSAEGVVREVGIPDVGKDPAIMDEAFERKTGEVSKLIRAGDDFILFKVKDRTAERIPELSEVPDEVVADYRKDQARLKAVKKAEEIIAALQKEEAEPADVIEQFGLSWKTLGEVSRTAPLVPMLGGAQEVKDMLTEVSPEQRLYPKPIRTKEGVAVVRLVEIKRASDKRYEEEKANFKRWIVEVRRTEFLKGWIDALKEKSEVVVHDRRL